MAEQGAIPARIRELIGTSIHSIEELELLLLLRQGATRRWTAEQLSRDLRLPESMAVTALQALVSGKLAVQVGVQAPLHYQYGPPTQEIGQAIAELAEIYAESRLEVLMLLSSNAIERVRRGALTKFSDAFRFPSRKKDG